MLDVFYIILRMVLVLSTALSILVARAVFELVAVVAHIVPDEADEVAAEELAAAAAAAGSAVKPDTPPEGHLLAHIRALPPYLDAVRRQEFSAH